MKRLDGSTFTPNRVSKLKHLEFMMNDRQAKLSFPTVYFLHLQHSWPQPTYRTRRSSGSWICLGLLNATHRLSALLCITSETVLWRFQCVFDPLLEAEWSFLFPNISRCFRTYHSAAIIWFFIDPLREFRFYFCPISLRVRGQARLHSRWLRWHRMIQCFAQWR